MEDVVKKVSIIVPVYQAKDYLAHCIDSILNQTYQNTEIILVDDGSNDGSEKLCDDYSRQYSNVFCIHQKNNGVSRARNVGIGHARGEYILFVDSDDYIESDYVERACLALRQEDTDMYLCGYQSVENRGRRKGKKYYPLVKDGVWLCNNIGGVLLKLFDSSSLHAIGTKLYKRSIIEQYKLRFNEKWKYYEDIYFCLDYLSHCKGIYMQNRIMYYYQRDIESSLTKQLRNFNYANIHNTFCLLYKLIGYNNIKEDDKKRFGELYLEQIDLCLDSKIKMDKWYTNTLCRLYRKLSKDRFYENAMQYSRKLDRGEFFCIRHGIYFGAYLMRWCRIKFAEN